MLENELAVLASNGSAVREVEHLEHHREFLINGAEREASEALNEGLLPERGGICFRLQKRYEEAIADQLR